MSVPNEPPWRDAILSGVEEADGHRVTASPGLPPVHRHRSIVATVSHCTSDRTIAVRSVCNCCSCYYICVGETACTIRSPSRPMGVTVRIERSRWVSMWRTQRRQRFTSSAIATATLGVDVRNAFRMEAGAERPNDHLEETQTFATEADVDSVSGTISTANQFIRRSSRLRRPRYRPRRRYPRPDGLRSVRAGKRHRASRSHVTETGVDSSRAACET